MNSALAAGSWRGCGAAGRWECPVRVLRGLQPRVADRGAHTAAAGADRRCSACSSSARTRPRSLARAVQESVYSGSTDVRGGQLLFIGIGPRGASAVAQLRGDARDGGQDAQYWAVDIEGKAQPMPPGVNQVLIQPAQDLLPPADLQRICPANALAASPGASTSVLCTAGVAFIIAGAAAITGGSPLLLQLAAHLRRQGLFVATELTMPFDFEGKRKLEEAHALVEALAGVAQLTVLVSQEVLCRAYSALTVKEASAISDTTLVYIARSILWAVSAPELLIATPGDMAWHGRDLRQYRRLLAPPLERLLTCPGTGALGRGQASIPREAALSVPLASTLSTLAEDCVKAAADSPFLEHAMASCGAVLCILTLPASALQLEGSSSSSSQRTAQPAALQDPQKYALRAAVQVAAMTVMEVAGPQCHDVVVCAHVTDAAPQQQQQQPELRIEATMLVLEDPAAAEARAASDETTAAAASASRPVRGQMAPGSGLLAPQGYPYMTPPGAAAAAAGSGRDGGGGGSRPSAAAQRSAAVLSGAGGGGGARAAAAAAVAAGGDGGAPAAPPARRPQSSMWSAMSAIAGGSAAAAVSLQQQAPSSPGVPSAAAAGRGARSSSGGGSNSSPPPRAAPGAVRSAAAPPAAEGAGSAAPAPGAAAGGGGGGQWHHVPWQVDRLDQRLTRSLVAQSLDLPPTAARWRHQARAAREGEGEEGEAAAPARKGWSFWGLAVAAGAAPQEGDGDGGDDEDDGGVRDVRGRVAGMLRVERGSRPDWGDVEQLYGSSAQEEG